MRELQERRGYQEVSTPILVSERLWRQSGHWDHYAENMFVVESGEPAVQPQAHELPESTLHLPEPLPSYRDPPLRFAEYGRLHRNERLARCPPHACVTIQDDAHLRSARPADGGARGAPSTRSGRPTRGSAWCPGSRSPRG
ncbi:MAG: hypothetical protein R3C32_10585 [Chloroflexota bacterium]